tara:strand:- start:546 stop:938 length:393 start_codon:yes stop_codon:yes gene_type:complete
MTRGEMNWKIVRSIIPIIALFAFLYYTKSFKTDFASEKPVLTTNAASLFWRFQINEADDLINKIVQVNGEVTGFDSTLLILNNSLICYPENNKKIEVEIGKIINIKGRCISYDDLLQELRLDHVILIQET